jgi:hypothetical protein
MVAATVPAFPLVSSAAGAPPPGNLQFLRAAAVKAASEAIAGLPLEGGATIALQARREGASRPFWEEIFLEALTAKGFQVERLDPAGAPVTAPAGGAGAAAGGAPAGGQRGRFARPKTAIELATGADSAAAAGSTPAGIDSSAAPVSETAATGMQPVARRGDFDGPCLQFEEAELSMNYTRAHGGRIFGHPTLERQARAGVFLDLSMDQGGRIRWAGRGEASETDRVHASRLREVESSPLPVAAIPKWEGKSIITRAAEPTLVVGIVGGLVYLFYANKTN